MHDNLGREGIRGRIERLAIFKTGLIGGELRVLEKYLVPTPLESHVIIVGHRVQPSDVETFGEKQAA
jgi:hypothetical protein